MLLPLLLSALIAQTNDRPLRSVTDPGVITTRQAITPAGVPAVFNGRVYAVDFGKSADELWVLTATQVYRLNWRQNQIIEHAPTGGAPGLQSLRFDASGSRALLATSLNRKQLRLGTLEQGKHLVLEDNLGTILAGSLAIASKPNARGVRIGAVPLIYDNELAVVDLQTGKRIGRAKTGIAPFGVALDETGSVAWVSNWGGRVPAPDARTAPLGYNPNADRVVVDTRGAAASGTVSRIDLTTLTVTHTINVDPHPNAIALDHQRNRLYVASSNRDTVSVRSSPVDRQNALRR